MLVPGYASLVLTILAAAGAAVADAGVRPVEVQLEGFDGCPGANAFLDSLRSRIDEVRAAEKDEPRTVIHVHLSLERGHVIGRLRVTDDHGQSDTRTVQGASCNDVVQALSLTAALVLDPTALLSVPATSAGPDETAKDEVAVPEAEPSKGHEQAATADAGIPPASATKSMASTEVGAAGVGLTVLAGSFSPGIGLAARKTIGDHRIFRTTLGLGIAYVRNDLLQSPGNAQVALIAATATACPLHWDASFVTMGPCALLVAGRLSAAGRQLTHVNAVDRLWLSAGLTARAAAAIGAGLSLELEGGFTVPLLKRQFFATTPSNVVAETPTISPMISLGLAYGF